MRRTVLAAVGGFFAWWVVATVLDRALRLAWPSYAAALPLFAFSPGMLLARLIEGAASTVAAGVVAGWIARRGAAAGVATGVLVLVFFVPVHVMIWSRFPVWYHLLFLGSLLPLAMIGRKMVPRR